MHHPTENKVKDKIETRHFPFPVFIISSKRIIDKTHFRSFNMVPL